MDNKPKVRIYMDGCFDLMHIGHSNALRQARALGTTLVVGIVGDEEIAGNKGCMPLMKLEERYAALKACRFVDEVIVDVPYELTPSFTNILRHTYSIDYIVHGDDACVTHDGKDAYATAKGLNMFKTVKRTSGISTTDLVCRILRASGDTDLTTRKPRSTDGFLLTSHLVVQFSKGTLPRPTDIVVYVSGSWDLLHAGHLAFLEAAKSLGDFLLVGVHDDDVVHAQHGSYPIMNVNERALNLLTCRHVDEVMFGAPWVLTEDMIKNMRIQLVAQEEGRDKGDAYRVATKKGIVCTLPVTNKLSTGMLLERVRINQASFLSKCTSQEGASQRAASM
jgi:ethanolamine-phosphate cytidylyltransferase